MAIDISNFAYFIGAAVVFFIGFFIANRKKPEEE